MRPIPEHAELARLHDAALLHVARYGTCLHCGQRTGPTGRCWVERTAAARLAEAGWPHPHGLPAPTS